MGPDWQEQELRATLDPALGGRWTSLRTAHREWLWSNPDPAVAAARRRVRPGQEFVDAGGGEECLPTVQGLPDHGDVWSRPWHRDGDGAVLRDSVATPPFSLHREVGHDRGPEVAYRISGPARQPFLHAVHLLLQVGPQARIELAGTPRFRVAGEPGEHRWPELGADDLSRLGPDDGTARCLVLPEVSTCRVVDGADALEMSWHRVDGSGAGAGLLVWRNLRGWPESTPYRSIGVEPMLGATVNHAEPQRCARLDETGHAAWVLRLRALRAGPAPQ